MVLSEELNQILNRIEQGQETEEDINVLCRSIRKGDRQLLSQFGKYNIII